MNQRRSAQPTQPAAPNETETERAPPALQPNVQDHIGRQLRAIYDDLLSQPVPDRFRELMEKLDKSTGESE
ncbi:hypothetical protein NK718_02015 [Alsobacter sp. SYSU M60028]|uniref:Anti-sigma factor NepR domain-containing protein n=1 Tax=Alsobacter ponti TaxID=2962936 RepID=A0ABT1LAJ8_9HYPH|nr:NepR family anti-sigma factor [Alsobacter ponti]MCP8937278.1 hypothetical protein [Alsobacter ponti]